MNIVAISRLLLLFGIYYSYTDQKKMISFPIFASFILLRTSIEPLYSQYAEESFYFPPPLLFPLMMYNARKGKKDLALALPSGICSPRRAVMQKSCPACLYSVIQFLLKGEKKIAKRIMCIRRMLVYAGYDPFSCPTELWIDPP